MRKIKILCATLIFMLLFNTIILFSPPKKKGPMVPGIQTMRTFGTKLGPVDVLDKIGETMSEMPGGSAAYAIYNASMNAPNTEKVYVIESITFNKKGLATDIKGRIETPSTYRDFIAKGGMGVPVYEAKEPNEFGLIFGRSGDLAIRDGVIVKVNPLEEEEIYDIEIGSEIYDKISTASLLFHAYSITRKPFLDNMIIELQGILLNTASKDTLLKAITEFRKKNKKMSETEVMINFLSANKSYLKEIKKSSTEARKRIKESKKMVNSIGSACALQVTSIVTLFADLAADILIMVADPLSAPGLIAEYVIANVPKGSKVKYKNLEDVRKYGNYRLKEYQTDQKKNKELWKNAMEVSKDIL